MEKYVQTPSIININGFCGSGKSYFCKYFCKTMKKHFSGVIVFSNTAEFTNDYEFFKKNFNFKIYKTIDVDTKIKMILEMQKKNREANKKTSILVIFDDVFATVEKSKIFKQLITTFRHYNITIIFSTQYVCGSTTVLREISQYIIIFNQRSLNSLKACYESYFIQDYETFKDFKINFVKSLENYQFYFIDRLKNKKFIMKCPSNL